MVVTMVMPTVMALMMTMPPSRKRRVVGCRSRAGAHERRRL